MQLPTCQFRVFRQIAGVYDPADFGQSPKDVAWDRVEYRSLHLDQPSNTIRLRRHKHLIGQEILAHNARGVRLLIQAPC